MFYKILTLFVWQTKKETYANSVDPDEMVHNELSHQDQHCLPKCSGLDGNPSLLQWTCPDSRMEESISETPQ